MAEINLRVKRADDAPGMAKIALALTQWFNAQISEKISSDSFDCDGLVAEDEAGNLQGFILWQRAGEACYIRWLAVAKELHRHGIGRRLIEGTAQCVCQHGMTRLMLDTLAPTHIGEIFEPYARTRDFYEAVGFRLERIDPKGFPDGSDKAVYVLEIVQ